MAYATLEDPTGRVEVAIFPKVYAQFQNILKDDSLFIMEGRLDLRRDVFQFSVNTITPVSLDSMIKNAQDAGLYDANEKIVRKQKTFEAEPVAQHDPLEEEFGPPPPPAAMMNADWQENPFVIEVPAGADLKKMEDLKNLLISHPGERRVELSIRAASSAQKMKLPFGIQVSDDLQQQLKVLLAV